MDRPTWRPDRMAWVTPNGVAETPVPKTAKPAATTITLAAITERRAGTAPKVVRIRPLLYSPTTVTAPMLLAASMSTRPAGSLKASRIDQIGTKCSRMFAEYVGQLV